MLVTRAATRRVAAMTAGTSRVARAAIISMRGIPWLKQALRLKGYKFDPGCLGIWFEMLTLHKRVAL